MTWTEPVISEKWIAGTFKDLDRLSKIIENKLEKHKLARHLKLDQITHPVLKLKLFFVMADNFDPTSIEFNISQ